MKRKRRSALATEYSSPFNTHNDWRDVGHDGGTVPENWLLPRSNIWLVSHLGSNPKLVKFAVLMPRLEIDTFPPSTLKQSRQIV